MVCKESLCSWFKNLSPHKRIDFMCGMLHMCLPMELRFIGSFVEDLAKKEFNHLRESEGRANNRIELSNFNETDEKIFRTKMAIYLALLHSSNRSCSNIIFRLLEANLKNAFTINDNMDELTIHHILLVLSMAMNHPAFSYIQKARMYEHYKRSVEDAEQALPKPKPPQNQSCALILEESCDMRFCDQGLSPASSPRIPVMPSSPLQPPKVYIHDIELKSSRQIEKGQLEYKLQVTWSNGEIKAVYKTFQELADFHAQLLLLFPEDCNAPRHERKLPFLSVPASQKDVPEVIKNYIRLLLKVPRHILECECLVVFFQAASVEVPALRSCQDASTSPRSHSNVNPISQLSISGDEESVIPDYPAKSLTVYNSHLSQSPSPRSPHSVDAGSISPRSPGHHGNTTCNANHSPVCSTRHTSSLISSPCQSPASSLTDSPVNSRSASPGLRADNSVSQLLKHLQLQKYSEVLTKFTEEQLCGMSIEELERLGMMKDGAMKLKSKLEVQARVPNGLIDPAAIAGHPNLATPLLWPHPPPTPYLQHQPMAFQPQLGGHPFYYSIAYPPAPPAALPRELSPPNSEYSSPSPSPLLQPKTHPPPIQPSDSSSDDNEKGKVLDQDILNGRRVGNGHPVLTMSNSTSQLDDRQKEDGTNVNQTGVVVNSERTENQAGPAVNSGNSGYLSDPTPGYTPRPQIIRPAHKAQPAHANLGIPPKHMISMPDYVRQAGYGPLGQPHIRENTMTTMGNMGYSMASTDSGPRPYIVHIPSAPMLTRSHLGGNGHRQVFSSSGLPGINQQVNSVPMATPTVSKGNPGSGSVPGVVPPGIALSQQVSVNGLDPVGNAAGASNDATSRRQNVMATPASQSGSTATSLTSCHASCTTCGCPGHTNTATAYPYGYPYIPPGILPLPHGTNGILPTPFAAQMYLPQGHAHYPNGVNPEVLYNSAHHPGYSMNSVGNPGVTSNVMYGFNYCNSHQNPGHGTKPKRLNCHNCGSAKHIAADCTENSMEAMTSHFHYTYKPKSDSE